jgi:hypothetical protein
MIFDLLPQALALLARASLTLLVDGGMTKRVQY